MEDYSRPTTTHKTPHPKIGFVYIIPIGLFLGFIIFTAVFFMKKQGVSLPALSLGGNVAPSPTPVALVTAKSQAAVPTPTTVVEAVTKEDISIMVLNGSGVAGAAGKVATLLNEAGYASVETGNADAYDAADLTIRYKAAAKNAVADLTKDLEASYTVAKADEASFTGTTDIEIIVGK